MQLLTAKQALNRLATGVDIAVGRLNVNQEALINSYNFVAYYMNDGRVTSIWRCKDRNPCACPDAFLAYKSQNSSVKEWFSLEEIREG